MKRADLMLRVFIITKYSFQTSRYEWELRARLNRTLKPVGRAADFIVPTGLLVKRLENSNVKPIAHTHVRINALKQ